MSSNYQCKKRENEVVISILENERNRRLSQPHGPQTELSFKKAMKMVSKIDFVIQNEWHAQAIEGIGDKIAPIIGNGLILRGRYERGRGPIHETRRCQEAIKRQLAAEIEERKNKTRRKIIINKKYIPKKQADGENTATRAMFIVLGLSRQANENGLDKNTIISRARHYTPVDMNAKHDRYQVYDGFKGMSTLIEKGYVIKQRKKLFIITEAGYECYLQHCQPQPQPQHVQQMVQPQPQQHPSQQHPSQPQQFVMTPQIGLNDINLQKALHLSALQNMQENINDNELRNEDLELQQVLLSSQQTKFTNQRSTFNNGYDEAKELEKALMISEQEAMYNNSNNNNGNSNNNNHNHNNHNNNSDVVVSFVEKRTYLCRICIPNKTYKSKKHFDKHMQKHNNNNNNNNNNDNVMNDIIDNQNNNVKIMPSILGKRKQLDEYDSEIEILPISHPSSRRSSRSCPPKKKSKKCVVKHSANCVSESSAMKATKIKCDLDTVKLQNNSYLNNKRGNCYVNYDGKRYRLKLYIDTAEQNLQNRSLHYFNVLEHAKQKGVYAEYQKLANADYVIVMSQNNNNNNNNNNKCNIYMINFAVERKRWDDLEQSVLVDGRGKQQKERLKLTPIERKYYIVEGNERMIRDVEKREKCKHFLKQTSKDGYMIKYTQSKHETINKICEWYYKLLYFFNHRGSQAELVLTNSYGFPYSFEEFQESQKIIH